MPIIDQLVPPVGLHPVMSMDDGWRASLPAEWFLPSIHSVYLQIFSRMLSLPLSVAQRDSLGQPRLLPLLDYLPIFDATRALHRPHGGRYLGLQIPMAAHGVMGAAAMVSQSIGHAMETIARYAHIRNRMFEFECLRSHGMVRLLMRPRIPFHAYGLFIESVTVFAKFGILRAMVHPADLQRGRVLLPWAVPEIDPQNPIEDSFECIYQAPTLGFEFPVDLADQPSALYDPGMYRHVCQSGDEEL